MSLRIGEFLVQKGAITPAQVDQILEHGKRTHMRFGEAAVDLGLLSEAKLISIFGKNYRVNFFHLDARYFPRETKNLLPAEAILKWGALPLGSKTEQFFFRKTKIFNIGMLDPGSREGMEALEGIVRRSAQDLGKFRLKFFLILTDQYLEVIRSVYGITPETLKSKGAGKMELDQTLEMFIRED